MSLPWNPEYTPPAVDNDLLKQVTGVVEGAVNAGTQAATTVGSEIAGQIAGQEAAATVQAIGSAAQGVEQGVESVAGAVAPTIAPQSSAPEAQSTAPAGGTSPQAWINGLENIAISSAKGAAEAALPAIESRLAHAAATALQKELGNVLGTNPQIATIPKGDLKKVDAWERAGRTFLSGIAVTVLLAIINTIVVASSAGNVNWFSRDGWYAVGTLAVGSVVNAVAAYALRYLREPAGASIDSAAVKS